MIERSERSERSERERERDEEWGREFEPLTVAGYLALLFIRKKDDRVWNKLIFISST